MQQGIPVEIDSESSSTLMARLDEAAIGNWREVEIHGTCEAGFEGVKDAFAGNFERGEDVGAACSVYSRGECVVDLWGGIADRDNGRPWARDTIQIVFSSTKGVTATCIHHLAQSGALDLDAPVAQYWPEFAANGKSQIPVRWVLSHRAGLAHVEGDLRLEDVLAWDPVVEAIAAQPPNWEPGSVHGYHVRTFGWILGELVRRITGASIGAYFAREIAEPLGLDFWIGLPEREVPRCAKLIPPDTQGKTLAQLLGEDSLTARAMSGPSNIFSYDDTWNRPEVLAAEMPSSNGVGDARSLARMYAATVGEVDGIRILSPDTVERARAVQSQGRDKIIILRTCFGLGYGLAEMLPPACGPASFGHSGAGGSIGFADPESQLAFGYVMNRMKLGMGVDDRGAALVEALYRCTA
jgi:CubicO group peptidase (beta-lactamase class C family)